MLSWLWSRMGWVRLEVPLKFDFEYFQPGMGDDFKHMQMKGVDGRVVQILDKGIMGQRQALGPIFPEGAIMTARIHTSAYDESRGGTVPGYYADVLTHREGGRPHLERNILMYCNLEALGKPVPNCPKNLYWYKGLV